MKREFLVVGGRPLLAGDFIGSLVRSSRITQKPVVIIGLSTDEAITYSLLSQRRLPKGKQPPPLIGINKGLSPSLEEMIADGEVETISDEVEMINPAALEPGKIYLIKRDVVEKDLPFPDSSVVIGMLYVLHHFPKARRLETVRQIMKKSVALHIFEGLSSENLLRMVIEVNYYLGSPHSGIDAGWTHICGGQTDESFRGFIAGLDQEEGWEIKSYPRLPSFPPLQSKVIPHQQLGIIWRRR